MDERISTTAVMDDDGRAWGPTEVAHFLRISVRGLQDVRAEDPTFPAPRRVGRKLRWCPDVVRGWVRGEDAVVKPQPNRRGRGRV